MGTFSNASIQVGALGDMANFENRLGLPIGGSPVYINNMKWFFVIIWVLAMSAPADAQNASRSHGRGGLDNKPVSGLGARTEKALPLLEPQKRRSIQTPNSRDDYYTRSNVRPLRR